MSDSARAKTVGIYNLHMPTRGGGEKLTLVLAEHLSRDHDVQLFHNTTLDPKTLEETFAVDLSRVKFTKLEPVRFPLRAVAKIRGRQIPFSGHHYLQLKELDLDLFINISHGSTLPNPARRGIFLCMFPSDLSLNLNGFARMRNSLASSLEKVVRTEVEGWLNSYSEVIAISQYSADWVRRLWQKDPEVVYPPVDDMGPPGVKERIILHVGRFTPAKSAAYHNKAQDFLLAAFGKMTELHHEGWELHFAGNIGLARDAGQLATTLLERAEELPVRFHFNAPFEELRNLYRRAAIYWHATGVGNEPAAYPARQEHFGITTVEAMSAGAVPVVINSGGQTEIVSDGVNGFCWNEIDGLLKKTQMLVENSDLRDSLSRAAIESSKKFRREVFVAGMDESIKRVLYEPAGPNQ